MRVLQNCWYGLFCSLLLICLASTATAQEPTRAEKKAVRTIASTIDRVGRQFRNRKYESSIEYYNRAQAMVKELSGSASPELMALIKPEHERLKKAYGVLKGKDLKVDEVEPLPEAMAAGGDAVSFKSVVAPLIVAKCGRCHVRGNRGQFSAATYASLMDSGHVDPGKPGVSRLIEVIEDGDMPPGGSLLDEELANLKLWIKQGAKTDAGAADNLATLSGEMAPAPRLEVKVATGNETVSFSRDVAPLLVDNCSGCHVDVQNNARGNLNMTTFRQLLRGGDAGPMVKPGDGASSLLVKKLLGTGGGLRMPQGRAALKSDAIKTITTWIDEGATFDGGEATVAVRTLAARAVADSLSHEELSGERKRASARRWKTVMSGVDAVTAETDDLLVVSTYDQEQVDAIADSIQKLIPKIKAVLKGDKQAPLVKGKLTLFVFERRYDFNEFGVMIEGREIPRQLKSRWGFDTVNAYVAMLMTRDETIPSRETKMTRDVAATYVASLAPQVPRWFSDGMGYYIAARVMKGSDEVESWDSAAQAAFRGMTKPDDFIANRMTEDQAGLVAYLFVQRLRSSNQTQFNRLVGLLQKDQPFPKSFQQVYSVTPAEYLGVKRRR